METYKNIQVHGSLPEYADDGDELDRYYLPARSLSMNIRSPEDIVVLPEHVMVTTYARQLSAIVESLSRPTLRPVYIPDSNYLLDIAVAEHVELLADRLERHETYRVMPYAITEHTLGWIDDLHDSGFRVYAGNDVRAYYENLQDPSHRGGWGRHVSDPDRLSFPERYGIPYPVSWIANGSGEIVEAYERVSEATGSADIFFKPVFSAGGFTIKRISSACEAQAYYAQLEKQGALTVCGSTTPVEMQQALPVQSDELYSLQYDGSCIDTPGVVCRQVVDGVNWAGNIFNEGNGNKQEAYEIFTRIKSGHDAEGIPMNGNGGIDFAHVDGQLVILEQNGRRITGAHPAIAIAQGFGVEDQTFMNVKVPGDAACDLQTLWDVLHCEGVSYDPHRKTGIFPVVWMPGSGMLWGTGGSSNEMRQRFDHVFNTLQQKGYIQ